MSKFMMLKITALLVSIFGALSQSEIDSIGPVVDPEKLCPKDEISIKDSSGYNLSLAIITPEKDFLFLADHSIATLVPYYWKEYKFPIFVRDLLGFDYNEDGPYIRPVFKTPGMYEFYFAENLGTERDNTIAFSQIVEYLGDSPECAGN